MWSKLSLCLYMLLVDVVAVYLVIVPAYAFQVSSSTTGYVRTVTAAGAAPMFVANRAANISTIASAAASAGGTSLAIRMVTGLGWVGLGVSAGLLLYDLYYSSSELAAVKAAATVPAHQVVPGVTLPANAQVIQPCAAPFPCSGYDAIVNIPGTAAPHTSGCVLAVPTMPAGWGAWGNNPQGDGGCMIGHLSGQANAPVTVPATTGTASEISTLLQSMPASNPLSLESNTTPQGVSGSTVPADDVVTQSIPASSVPSQVVPATSVGPTDVVVNKDATAPAGTAPPTTATQTTTGTSTTTTTTTTDGNTTTSTTTTTETDTAPVSSCSVGNHEPRTFGGILQTHLDTWKGSGLLSALNLLGTLVWPTTSPTYTLTSAFFGTFTFDFSAWTGMLLAIRSIIIAIAGFVAYKIIFVGGRA
ncbi:MAG: hypothetical protein ABIU05_17835 [Nitrospirales bacterium]